jgi:hypothetical protein
VEPADEQPEVVSSPTPVEPSVEGDTVEHADVLTDNGAVTEEPGLEEDEAQEDSGSVEGVGLFGRTEAAADDDRSPDAEIVDVEPAETPDQHATGDEEPASPLSEARRRRRLRFPPR